MRLTTIMAQGLGPVDFTHELPRIAYLWGPTGLGKSMRLAAIELAATGRYAERGPTKIDQNDAGLLSLARDGRNLMVSADGESDQHGRWTVTRSWRTEMVPARQQRGKPPPEPGTLVPQTTQNVEQSFDPSAKNDTASKAAVATFLSTLPEIWDARLVLGATSSALRAKLLGALIEGSTVDWLPPGGLPGWLAGNEHLDPEPWIRMTLAKARARANEQATEATNAQAALQRIPEWGLDVDLDELAAARDRAVAALAAHDSSASRIKERVATEEKLVKTREELSASVAQFGTIDPAKYDSAILVSKKATELDERIAKLEASVAGAPPAPTELDLSAAAEALAEAEKTLSDAAALAQRRRTLSESADRLRARYRETSERVRALREQVCPHCGKPQQLSDIESGQAALEELRLEGVAAGEALSALPAVPSLADLGTERTAAERALLTLQERARKASSAAEDRGRLAEARREREEIGPVRSVAKLEAEKTHATEQQRLTREIARLLAQLDGLSAGAPPETDRDELEAAKDRAVEAANRAVERDAQRKLRDASTADLAEARNAEKMAKEWVARLTEIQRKMLGSVVDRLIVPLRELTGLDVSLRLVDARGHEDCEFRVGFAPVATLSTGEQTMFLAGLFGALYRVSGRDKVAWRPLILDRMESVSKAERERFLAKIREHLKDDAFDQAIFAGCHDEQPSVKFLRIGNKP